MNGVLPPVVLTLAHKENQVAMYGDTEGKELFIVLNKGGKELTNLTVTFTDPENKSKFLAGTQDNIMHYLSILMDIISKKENTKNANSRFHNIP